MSPLSGTGTQEKKQEPPTQNASAEDSAQTDPPIGSNVSDSKKTVLAVLTNPVFHAGLLIALCLACFGRTLGTYFLADDIGEVRYIWQIFNNNQWNLFWSNFTGNYMQVPNMAVYRPILMLSLVVDFLIWKGNAFGYYLTNLFCFIGGGVLLYSLLRQLSADWGRVRSSAAAFFASAMFATTPLHCESISWVVGRVDSLCALFYLAALNCFVRTRSKPSPLLTSAGLLFFFLAMGTKEMAIGLAPTLMAVGFLWMQPKSVKLLSQLKERAIAGWNFSRSVWAATLVYFVIRWLALGTLLGGYAGSVGASQSANALSKWMDGDSWRRLILPFSAEVYNPGNSNETMLFACYCALLGVVFVRALAGSFPWKWVFFLGFWALTQLAPIYRLFGIGANLEGARFCFFFSMSFSAILPVLLFAPEKKDVAPLNQRLSIVSALILAGTVFVLAKTAYASNVVWLHAGKEVRSVLHDAQKIAAEAPAGTKFALLGIPKEHGGAHMILNGSTFEMLLSPPFADRNYANSFVTFDPMLFGDDTAINGNRFRQLIANNGSEETKVKGPFVWNSANKKFEFVDLTNAANNSSSQGDGIITVSASTERATGQQLLPFVANHAQFVPTSNGIQISNPIVGDGVILPNLNIDPLSISYVRMHITSSADLSKLPFDLKWRSSMALNSNAAAKVNGPDAPEANVIRVIGIDSSNNGANSAPPTAPEKSTVTFAVGRKWRWYSESKIEEISIALPPLNNVTVEKVELLPASQLAPTLSAESLISTNSGAYCAVKPFTVNLAPAKVKGNMGAKYRVQISKNNHFFENFSKEKETLAVAKSFDTPDTKFTVRPEQLEGQGYYEIRACNIDATGNPISDYSDPITVLLQETAAANKQAK